MKLTIDTDGRSLEVQKGSTITTLDLYCDRSVRLIRDTLVDVAKAADKEEAMAKYRRDDPHLV